MAVRDAERPKPFKDFLLFTQLIHFPILYASMGILHDPDNLHHPEWAKTLLYQHPILYIFPVFAAIIGLKLALVAWDESYKPVKFTKCRRDLSIGYGGMIACGIIPQVLKVILMERVKDLILFSAVCAVSNFLFIGLFVLEHHENYGTTKKESKRVFARILRTIMILLQIIVTVTLENHFVRGKYSEKQTIHTEMWICMYTVCYIPCTAEFAVVLAGWIRLKEKLYTVAPKRESYRDLHRPTTNHLSRMVTVPTVAREEEHDETTGNSTSGTECNICMLRYSTTTVVPRMLVGCGHTVCQECIHKFPRQDIQSVLCPFCRNPTSLPDNLPNHLPKNYAVLDIIHNLEK
ncbi:hypothetical protein GCK72_011352 [Caenorhabditis remanei]|uniref:RING-type domain-containing protein n=1 Tax=Caenorhabditis remanei TaxID=31234 RepID=A0A6A5H7C1_CAERE|nr:hypothetical protein GCK72_011352 [Caenorhabditis remanei]KAF1763087.1 hypothetical protein GCK72_011352 [Caenorhabditis remanei]